MNCSFCGVPYLNKSQLTQVDQVLTDGFRVSISICENCIDAVLPLMIESQSQSRENQSEAENVKTLVCSFCSKNQKEVRTLISGGKFFRDDSDPENVQYPLYKDSFLYEIESGNKKLQFVGDLLICDECAQSAKDKFNQKKVVSPLKRMSPSPWMSWVLKAAALYNIGFALMTLIAPFLLFDITGATRPNLPELWQCIGMIVGVYGVGYWIAAQDPYRHWPIVLVGWLGKTFGPIGFAKAVWEGVFPLRFGWIIVFNDLIWWFPFACILLGALNTKRLK